MITDREIIEMLKVALENDTLKEVAEKILNGLVERESHREKCGGEIIDYDNQEPD